MNERVRRPLRSTRLHSSISHISRAVTFAAVTSGLFVVSGGAPFASSPSGPPPTVPAAGGIQRQAASGTPRRGRPVTTTSSGVFTLGQARRGAKLAERCTLCHGFDFEGEAAPTLMGPEFVDRWAGRTLGDMLERVNATQPSQIADGTLGDLQALSRQQIADVLAFILISNGYPAGQRELSIDNTDLESIRFAPPPAR